MNIEKDTPLTVKEIAPIPMNIYIKVTEKITNELNLCEI